MGDKVKSWQREIVKLWDEIRKLSKDFKNFKDKIVEKNNDLWSKSCINIFYTSEWTRCSILEWWLWWFSQVSKRRDWKVKKKLERRLNCIWVLCQQHPQGNRLFVYSYQYNIKITSDRETSEETVNFCLMMFAGIGVDISISDIDIAHIKGSNEEAWF